MNSKFTLYMFRLTLNQIKRISTQATRLQKKNHYDSLGLTLKATQADVKSAYYNLSKMYHPDTNKGNTGYADKFRDITEAYKVLGNVKLRKLYDKGFHVGPSSTTPDDPMSKFYRSRDTRNRPPPPTGRTPIYDFDEWSKNHYGATFQRSQVAKKRRENHRKINEDNQNDIKHEKMFLTFLFVALLCMYLLNYEKSKYDDVKVFIPGGTSVYKNDDQSKND